MQLGRRARCNELACPLDIRPRTQTAHKQQESHAAKWRRRRRQKGDRLYPKATRNALAGISSTVRPMIDE
jgi:hypothetical protein